MVVRTYIYTDYIQYYICCTVYIVLSMFSNTFDMHRDYIQYIQMYVVFSVYVSIRITCGCVRIDIETIYHTFKSI